MFDGKMFFGVTGTPIRNTALVNSAFADAEPVPFTFAKRTTKSLILLLFCVNSAISIPRDLDQVPNDSGAVLDLACPRDVVPKSLHVPGGGGAAFGAESAVEADVLVLCHD